MQTSHVADPHNRLAYILKPSRGDSEKFKKVQRQILTLPILEKILDVLNVKAGRAFRT